MVTGLREITGDSVLREGGKDLEAGVYYFSTEDGSGEGQMMTGKQTIDDEGDKYTYYFQKSGKAYTDRLVKGSVYGHDGVRLEAEDGSKYELVTVEYDILDEAGKKVVIPAGTQIIVNASGTVKKSARLEAEDGSKYELVTVEYDILDEAGKKVVIPAGTQIIVNASGTVKKSAATVDVDGVKYSVKDYAATEKADQD